MKKNKVKRKAYFRFIKTIIKIFVRKPKIINLNEEALDENAIYLSNHVGALGPVKHELCFTHNFKFWGTHEMVFKFKDRWKYLANDYFYRKKHHKKITAKLIATIVFPFVSIFYKGMELIPTYTNGKLMKTIEQSSDYLKDGNSIIIFPENSYDGYHEKLTEYFAGFILLAKYYYKKTKHNIKIYNMYVRKKDNTLIVDKYITVEEILRDERDIRETANSFKDRANQLAEMEKKK